MKLRDFFKHNKDTESVLDEAGYFEYEDAVEAALAYLDNHPSATLEEYEAWLDSRDKAIKKNKGELWR